MLSLSNLTKSYRTETVETTALAGVDLTIEQGDFVAIMGPSGCGKSTLLNILGLLDTPDSGSYRFLGQEITGAAQREIAALRKRHLGFVFQSFNLIEDLSVAENVELPLLYQRVARAERRRRVAEAMEAVGLGHRAGHRPSQLSGGQQQRVAVARAIVTRPAIILADEPTGNLDSLHGEEVMRLLAERSRAGTTVVMVTHSTIDAAHATRTIRLLDGRVVTQSQSGRPRPSQVASTQPDVLPC
jgi:putative ABC transport system ATP-binding protein